MLEKAQGEHPRGRACAAASSCRTRARAACARPAAPSSSRAKSTWTSISRSRTTRSRAASSCTCQSYPVTDKVTVDLRPDRQAEPRPRTAAHCRCRDPVVCRARHRTPMRRRLSLEEPSVSHPLVRTPPRDARARAVRPSPSAATGARIRNPPSPKVYGEGAAEAGKAAFDALLDKPFSADAAGHRRHGRRREVAVRLRARHHLSEGRPRRALRGRRPRAGRSGRRPVRRRGSACASKSCTRINQAELPDRQRGDAHDRPGVHDGVPGRRSARAGSRARGRRVRVGRDCAASRPARYWEKPQGKNEPHPDGEAFPRSCRAASGSSSAAARSRRGTAIPGLSRSRHRQRGRRQAASGRDPAARDHA